MPRAGKASGSSDRAVWRFDAIGTAWEIETRAPLNHGIRAAVAGVIDGFDREWSRFRADSLVSALARGAGAVAVPADARPMLDDLAAVAEATGGAVNPLVGRSLASLGYDAAYRLTTRGERPAPPGWRERLTWDDEMLRLTGGRGEPGEFGEPGGEPSGPERCDILDVGSLGKGRLVDLVLEVVSAQVGGDVVVDAGGDLAVRGAPQRIGLEHPYRPSQAIGVLEVTDEALCASATNRRAWGEGLHHVLDARTGAPVRTVAATWAVAPTAMRADAVATALFFDGGAELAAAWGVQWVRMTTDGRVDWSPGSRAELFTGTASVGS